VASDPRYDFASVTSIGKTAEGREMLVLRLEKAGRGKPNIWIEAGIHASEWIAPAMSTYIIDQLLNNDKDGFLSELNFHILVSANPDGYEYSRNKDRMWRKNRANHHSIQGCIGVDLNRNFGYHFAEGGGDTDKCSDEYQGPYAFSEIENQNIQNYVLQLDPVPILATSLHSYGQVYLSPYGYAHDAYPENWKEIRDLAWDAVIALQSVYGTEFLPWKACDFLGDPGASGTSDDWYKSPRSGGGLGARFAYAIVLRDKEDGTFGYCLPENQIEPSGRELWEAQRIVFKKMIEVSDREGGVVGQGDGGVVGQGDGGVVGQGYGGVVGQEDGGVVGQGDGRVVGQPDGGVVGQPDGGVVGQGHGLEL